MKGVLSTHGGGGGRGVLHPAKNNKGFFCSEGVLSIQLESYIVTELGI